MPKAHLNYLESSQIIILDAPWPYLSSSVNFPYGHVKYFGVLTWLLLLVILGFHQNNHPKHQNLIPKPHLDHHNTHSPPLVEMHCSNPIPFVTYHLVEKVVSSYACPCPNKENPATTSPLSPWTFMAMVDDHTTPPHHPSQPMTGQHWRATLGTLKWHSTIKRGT